MEHYHYTSGLQFLLDQSQKSKDWPSFFRMLPIVTKELLEQTCRSSRILFNLKSSNNDEIQTFLNNVEHHFTSENDESSEQLWQLWRWKPPVQSSLQTRDDYFHNPASTPHTIMSEFKKHLTVSKDLKFYTSALRRLAQIEYQPLMRYVTQDDYDDHTDSMVRSYFIFKDGVMPLWEDEYNVFGGCWSLIWNNDILRNKYHDEYMDEKSLTKKTSKFIWKQLINLLTDPSMVEYVDEICGVGLTIRSNKTYKITVWNRNSDDTITKMMIGQNIKSILGHTGSMFYYSHKSTLKNQYEKKKQSDNRIRRRSKTISTAMRNNRNIDDDEPKLNPNRSSGSLSRFLFQNYGDNKSNLNGGNDLINDTANMLNIFNRLHNNYNNFNGHYYHERNFQLNSLVY